MSSTINTSIPFGSLLGPNQQDTSYLSQAFGQQQQQQQSVSSSMTIVAQPSASFIGSTQHILTLSGTSNPVVFSFDNVYENVTYIEIIKTRFIRSEHTCEYYRNTPFVILTNDAQSLIIFDNAKFLQFQNELSIDPTILFTTLSSNVDNSQVSFPQRSFFYNYNLSSSLSGPNYGVCPYVLSNSNFTVTGLVNALNMISDAYLDSNIYVPTITSKYNSTTNTLYFESNEFFYLIPSNAYTVVGLRPDMIYISQLNTTTGKFTVYADFLPKLDGPDALYIQNDESQSSFKNLEYVSLATVYLPNDLYTTTNHNMSQDSIYRPIKYINKLNKLTLTFYTDLTNKFLFQTNGSRWFVDLILYGKV